MLLIMGKYPVSDINNGEVSSSAINNEELLVLLIMGKYPVNAIINGEVSS